MHILASGSDFHFSTSMYQRLKLPQNRPSPCEHLGNLLASWGRPSHFIANDRSGLKIASACERPPWRKKRHHSVDGITQFGGLVVDSLEENMEDNSCIWQRVWKMEVE